MTVAHAHEELEVVEFEFPVGEELRVARPLLVDAKRHRRVVKFSCDGHSNHIFGWVRIGASLF